MTENYNNWTLLFVVAPGPEVYSTAVQYATVVWQWAARTCSTWLRIMRCCFLMRFIAKSCRELRCRTKCTALRERTCVPICTHIEFGIRIGWWRHYGRNRIQNECIIQLLYIMSGHALFTDWHTRMHRCWSAWGSQSLPLSAVWWTATCEHKKGHTLSDDDMI